MGLQHRLFDVCLASGLLSTIGCMDPITCQDTLTCHLPDETSNTTAEAGLRIDSGALESRPSTNMTERSSSSSTGHNAADATATNSQVDKTSVELGLDGGASRPTPTRASDASAHEAGETTEASAEETSATDETTHAPNLLCDPSKPFGRPFAIDAINLDGVTENVIVTPDGLTAHIRYGTDLTTYVSTRSAIFEDFGTPTPYSGFESLLEDNSLLELEAITSDGLVAYMSEGVSEATPIRSSHRNNVADNFSQLIIHEELTSEGLSLLDPWVSLDGQRLYGFLPAAYTLMTSERGVNGFSEPTRIDDPSTLGSSLYSTILVPSEQVLYASVNNVEEAYTQGLAGIARATRDSASELFAEWELVTALDGPGWDQPIWISDDECEIIIRQDAEDAGLNPTDASNVFIARRGTP